MDTKIIKANAELGKAILHEAGDRENKLKQEKILGRVQKIIRTR